MNCPIQNYLNEADRPRWWCLQSRTSGKYICDGVDDHGDPIGHVLVFWDRQEAEAAAVAHRETYPTWLIEAVPLPAHPPTVIRQKVSKDDELLSVQTILSLRGESIQVEIRQGAGNRSKHLLHVLTAALRAAANAEPETRMSPVQFIRIGAPRKQAETVDKVA